MPYATIEQLCDQYGYTEVSQLLADEEDLVTEVLLRDAIAGNDLSGYTAAEQAAIAVAQLRADAMLDRQSALIDSKLGVRYQLPLSQTVIDASPLIDCALALTRASLSDDGDNVAKHILEERSRWLGWLGDLAKDNAVLLGATKIDMGGNDHRRLTAQPPGVVDLSEY